MSQHSATHQSQTKLPRCAIVLLPIKCDIVVTVTWCFGSFGHVLAHVQLLGCDVSPMSMHKNEVINNYTAEYVKRGWFSLSLVLSTADLCGSMIK